MKLGTAPVTCAGDVLFVLTDADVLVRASGIESEQAAAALVGLELARRVALEDGV